jgi:hypothetical protein
VSDKLIQSLESQRKDIEENLDKVFVEYIKRKYGYACVLTVEKRNTIVGCLLDVKAFPNLRWLADNYFVIARREYDVYNNEDPFKIIDWYVDTYGKTSISALRREAYARTKQFSVQELMTMTNYYINKTQALPKAKASNGR